MRVLMLLEGWGVGGTERYVERHCWFLHRNTNVNVSLALLSGAGSPEGDQVKSLFQQVHLLGGGGWRSSMTKLLQLLRIRQFDLLHLHLYSNLLPGTLVGRCVGGVPVLTTLHMPLTSWGTRHRLGWRASVRMAHRVVANSQSVANSLGQFGRLVDIVPGCIDDVEPDYRYKGRGEGFRIVGVGRLSREKSWDTLIEALSIIRRQGGNGVTCRIIGGGSQETHLRSLAARRGVSDMLHLTGPLPSHQVPAELSAADLFVLPSRFEGLGLAPLEAMAAGVPTLTSDFPAAREFIHDGETGHRFPIGDARRLAELICWHRDHPTESSQMGQRGRTSVLERYSEENTVARYVDIYRQLAGPSSHDI